MAIIDTSLTPIASLGGPGVPVPPVSPTAKQLNVQPILQEQTEWCWAACLKMVLEANGDSSKVQGDFPNAAFNLTSCNLLAPSIVPSSSQCNTPIPVSQFAGEYHRYLFSASLLLRGLRYNEIEAEIKAGNPIQIGIGWKGGGGGHAILIMGCDSNSDGSVVIWINSLDQSVNQTQYDDFLTNFNQWQWQFTWTGIRR